ncbi:MAG: SDR family oxidoreductase [Mycobacteriaceae bacterium]
MSFRKRSIDLSGQVVAITGGARGIGAATATALSALGARVAIGDIDVKLAEKTASDLRGQARGYLLDVSDPDAFAGFLDRVEQDCGPLDVLINNAGIMPISPFIEESVQSIRRQLDINVSGVIYGTQEGIRRMAPRNRGHVVNIASAAGKVGFPGVATYCATKFAVVGLTEAVALEYSETGIGFTCVMPGIVNTELASGLDEHWLLKNSAPEDIAEAIVNAICKNKHDVYVPKRLATINKIHAGLPRGIAEKLMKALGADNQLLDSANSIQRKAYDARISNSTNFTAEVTHS